MFVENQEKYEKVVTKEDFFDLFKDWNKSIFLQQVEAGHEESLKAYDS